MLAASVAGVVLFGFATPPPGASVWVAVNGPPDADPPEDLVLEIGDSAWSGYGGVTSHPAAEALRVRLIGRDSCQLYADFIAQPGTQGVIRFANNGSNRVEDWTGRPMDAGPALGQRLPSGCPDAAATTEPQRSSVLPGPTPEQRPSLAPAKTTEPQQSSVAPGPDLASVVVPAVAILVVLVLGAGAFALTRRT